MKWVSKPTIDGWIRRLDWSLQVLPTKDRAEIIRETRSHIDERIAQGMDEQDVLISLGRPEDYARGFNDGFKLLQALGSRDLFRMMRVAAQWLTRSGAAAFAVTAVSCLGLFVGCVVLTAILHFFDPAHWGLWLSKHFLLFGQVNSADQAHELLGAWIYPFAMVSLIGCWIAGRAALLWALRGIARR